MASMVYRSLCRFGDRVIYPILPPFARPAWNHPAGPKTVFFWAPTIKWILVGAGLADLARPAEKLSIPQVGFSLIMFWTFWVKLAFLFVFDSVLLDCSNSFF